MLGTTIHSENVLVLLSALLSPMLIHDSGYFLDPPVEGLGTAHGTAAGRLGFVYADLQRFKLDLHSTATLAGTMRRRWKDHCIPDSFHT